MVTCQEETTQMKLKIILNSALFCLSLKRYSENLVCWNSLIPLPCRNEVMKTNCSLLSQPNIAMLFDISLVQLGPAEIKQGLTRELGGKRDKPLKNKESKIQ
jgi:hypothetical protein